MWWLSLLLYTAVDFVGPQWVEWGTSRQRFCASFHILFILIGTCFLQHETTAEQQDNTTRVHYSLLNNGVEQASGDMNNSTCQMWGKKCVFQVQSMKTVRLAKLCLGQHRIFVKPNKRSKLDHWAELHRCKTCTFYTHWQSSMVRLPLLIRSTGPQR